MQRQNTCCVCLKTNLVMLSIVETDSSNLNWSYKLSICVSEVMWREEDFICLQCIEQLQLAFEFRELCLQSYVVRKQQWEDVQASKIEEIIVVKDIPIKLEVEENNQINLHEHDYFQSENGPNKSFLRDLLQNPNLKNKNYTAVKSDVRNTEEKASTEKIQEYIDDCRLDDDVIYIKEETEISKSPSHKDTANEGVEFVEVNNENHKSLLRDLLLTPPRNRNNCSSQNFRYITVSDVAHSNVSYANSLETQPDFHTTTSNLKSSETFNKRIKRPPDLPRSEHHQCKMCTLKFNDCRSLAKHNKELHQKINAWDCKYCTKSYKTYPQLKQHEKSHMNQRKYECSICHRSYNTTAILSKHKIIKHTPPKYWKYSCSHCEQKFPFKAYRDRHVQRNHSGPKNQYICYHCNIRFDMKVLLIAHMRYKHKPRKSVKQCYICHNIYGNRMQLDYHMLLEHHIESIKLKKKYKCDKCNKLYTTIKARETHFVKCDGIKKHVKKN